MRPVCEQYQMDELSSRAFYLLEKSDNKGFAAKEVA